METIYIPTTEFVIFIKSQGDKAQLKALNGKFRWIVTREDGTEYIARPIECLDKELPASIGHEHMLVVRDYLVSGELAWFCLQCDKYTPYVV